VANKAAPDGKKPALYILAVGVSDYNDKKLNLNYAASDAYYMAKAFKEKHGGTFSKVEAKVLLDKQATKRNVARGLKWLKQVMTQRDVCIVFFSGHGTRNRKGTFFFVPCDVDIRDTDGTCVPGEPVKRLMANLPGKLIFILDACHSGAAAEKGETADDLTRDLMTEDYGIVVMSSSMGDEPSLESPEVRGGFFTKALIEGLSGAADLNRDGKIFLHELDTYIQTRVRQTTRGQQNPVTGRPPGFETFEIARK
jgi:uncharacterized caspase-like protein